MPLTLSLTSSARAQFSDILTRISTGPRNAQGVDLEGNSVSLFGDVGLGGTYAVFQTRASNLGVDPRATDPAIFYKNLVTGAIEKLADGSNPVIGMDGRFVVFEAQSIEGDFSVTRVYAKDMQTGVVRHVGSAAPDAQGNEAIANRGAGDHSISADGRYVVFYSFSTNLDGGGTSTGDIFRKDLQTGAVVLVSKAADGQSAGDDSSSPDISANGRYVVFVSFADNHAGASNGKAQVFRKDLETGAVVKVSTTSRDAQGKEVQAATHANFPSISDDGRYVVFVSEADNLVAGDTNGKSDIFLKDLVTGVTTRVSTGAGNVEADQSSYNPSISPDGRYVVFESQATNLDGGDGQHSHIFRKDVLTGEIVRIGRDNQGPDDASTDAHFSADGRSIVFTSYASNLVDGDRNNRYDVFRVDNDLLTHRRDVTEGRALKVRFDVGTASSARVDWGDGTSDTVAPAGGKVAFAHAYASAGVKTATVTVTEGAQTWAVPHRVEVATATMSRDTSRHDTLSGGDGSDQLAGDGFGNRLFGRAGADILKGEAGNDTLGGGEGKDKLTGGKGAASKDAFVFDTKLTDLKGKPSKSLANKSKDEILDFGPKYDSIWFDDAAFTNKAIAKHLKNKGASLDKPVKMKSSFFKVGDRAADKDDFFIYNARTKKLYFDVDGSGAKAMVEIASLKLQKGEGSTLTAADFYFV